MIEFLKGLGILCVYFFVCASAALLLRHCIRIPSEVFRKLLHFILLCSLFIWTHVILGVITNSWFWIRYRKLNKENPNTIFAAQVSLYRAKALVDICVTIALIAVTVSPGSLVAYFMDIAGSVIVVIYLFINGAVMIFRKETSTSY